MSQPKRSSSRRTTLPVSLALLVAAVALSLPAWSAAAPRTTRASVSSAGSQANAPNEAAALSATGRFVVFHSRASNLVRNDRNRRVDVFLRDRRMRTTRRLSVGPGGLGGNGASASPAISAGGRFVAFESGASSLVSRDTNVVSDIFVRDRRARTTRRVSVSSAEAQAGGPSFEPAISADGRFVAFDSIASNLVGRDRNGAADIFVRDRRNGTTRRVSVSSAEAAGNGHSSSAAISGNGRLVAFASMASNLVAGDTNGETDVFVRNRKTGRTLRVTVRSNGAQANGGSAFPAISADGRFVAFRSSASNLVRGDTNGHADVFVHDRRTGRTRRMSVGRGGAEPNGPSDAPAISANGRVVAFESSASNLVAADANGLRDVFVRDRVERRTRRVSVSSTRMPGNGLSERAALSRDGRVVAFASVATNLVRTDTNGRADVFTRGPLR